MGAIHLGKNVPISIECNQWELMVVLNFGCAILMWKCGVAGRWWPKILGAIWAANMIRMLILN